jgi:isopentenyl-diphosphate delta-isomerase type 1
LPKERRKRTDHPHAEEHLDVLDADGNLTGIVKPKGAVHRDGDWHRAVHLWIVTSDAQLLLQRRSRAKITYPGLWDISCAGHVSAAESATTSALRELDEELGITAEASELEEIGVIVDQAAFDSGRHLENEFQTIFVMQRDVGITELRLQEDEVEEVALVAITEFAARVARRDPTLAPHWRGYELLLKYLWRGAL